jgi:hypothetical protein
MIHEATIEEFQKYYHNELKYFKGHIPKRNFEYLLDSLRFEDDRTKRDLLVQKLDEIHWFSRYFSCNLTCRHLDDDPNKFDLALFSNTMMTTTENKIDTYLSTKGMLVERGIKLD